MKNSSALIGAIAFGLVASVGGTASAHVAPQYAGSLGNSSEPFAGERATTIAPKLSWTQEIELSVESLGGLPTGRAEMAIGARSQPWAFTLVNQGIGQGLVVKSLQRGSQGWSAPTPLGEAYGDRPEWQHSAFPGWAKTASSPEGPAVIWRSGASQLTLAVERDGQWTTKTIELQSGVLDSNFAYAWGPLWRREGITTLTLNSSQGLFGWRFEERTGRLVELNPLPPTARQGRVIEGRAQTMWFDVSGRLHSSHVEVAGSDPAGPADVVDNVWDEGANAWQSPVSVASGVVGFGPLRPIVVAGVSGLIWDAKDRRFGTEPQIEGAWSSDSRWTPMAPLESASIVTLPAVNSMNGGCLYTTRGYSILKPSTQPIRLGQSEQASITLRYLEAFQLENDICVIPAPYTPVGGGGWTSQMDGLPDLNGLPDLVGGTASTSAVYVTSVQGRSLFVYSLSIFAAAAPGPVRNLRVEVKRPKRIDLVVRWSAPEPTSYPTATFRFRWTDGKTYRPWMNVGTGQQITLTVAPGKIIRIQVRAVTSIGSSPVVNLQHRT